MISPLATVEMLSPHKRQRTHNIDTITIHCMAGNATVESCGRAFQGTEAKSANYGIGTDGRIACYVPEEYRSMASSNTANDDRAVTIEVANNGGAPNWPVSDKALESLIELIADVCQRNGIDKLRWKADPKLIGQVDKQNMTVHRWFSAKACPGNYLFNLHGFIAKEVNAKMHTIHTINDVPKALQPETKELIDCGALKGNGNDLDLSEDMLRGIIIGKRYADMKK